MEIIRLANMQNISTNNTRFCTDKGIKTEAIDIKLAKN